MRDPRIVMLVALLALAGLLAHGQQGVSAEAMLTSAGVALTQGDWEQAIGYWQAALREEDWSRVPVGASPEGTRLQLALALARVGQGTQARAVAEACCASHPSDAWTARSLATRVAVEGGDRAAVATVLTAVLERADASVVPATLRALGETEVPLADLDPVATQYLAAHPADPRRPALLWGRAELCWAKGDRDTAVGSWRAALAEDTPDRGAIASALAEALVALGRPADAVAVLTDPVVPATDVQAAQLARARELAQREATIRQGLAADVQRMLTMPLPDPKARALNLTEAAKRAPGAIYWVAQAVEAAARTPVPEDRVAAARLDVLRLLVLAGDHRRIGELAAAWWPEMAGTEQEGALVVRWGASQARLSPDAGMTDRLVALARVRDAEVPVLEQALATCRQRHALPQAALLQVPLRGIAPSVVMLEAEYGLFRQALEARDLAAAQGWRAVMATQMRESPLTIKASRLAKAAGIQ